MNMTKYELAYLAGIIDGEGCFTIEIDPPKSYRKGTLYTCRLSIINTDERLKTWLVDKVGGKIHVRKDIAGRKPCYAWRAYANILDELLPKIIPFLICKKDEAIAVLKFRSSFHGRGVKNTQDVCDFRYQCLHELKFHNTLGPT